MVNAEVLSDWTWMGGSSTVGSKGGQPGAYGTMEGTTAIGNVPGGRTGAASWSDSRGGHFWLFGGESYDANGVLGYPNDLWEFDSSTNEWTWMGGSSTVPCSGCATPGAIGAYDINNAPPPELFPSGRSGASTWIDGSGNLWLFGGLMGNGLANSMPSGSTSFSDLNDLWKFNATTNQWTMEHGVAGDIGPGSAAGDYGTRGTPASYTIPSGRYNAMTWVDGSGNLWLFGGQAISALVLPI